MKERFRRLLRCSVQSPLLPPMRRNGAASSAPPLPLPHKGKGERGLRESWKTRQATKEDYLEGENLWGNWVAQDNFPAGTGKGAPSRCDIPEAAAKGGGNSIPPLWRSHRIREPRIIFISKIDLKIVIGYVNV
jgi:hypothetical protein